MLHVAFLELLWNFLLFDCNNYGSINMSYYNGDGRH